MTLELKKVLGKFNLGTQDTFDSVKVCAFRTVFLTVLNTKITLKQKLNGKTKQAMKKMLKFDKHIDCLKNTLQN